MTIQKQFKQGDILFRQGDASDHVMRISSGEIEILREVGDRFGSNALEASRANIQDLVEQGLLRRSDDRIFLTSRGRLLSNEVFQLFIAPIEARSGT